MASSLFQKVDGLFQDEKGALSELSRMSPAEREAVRAQYKDQHPGHELDADIGGAMDTPAEKAEARALLAGDKVAAARAALDGATTDGFFGTGLTTDHERIHDTLAALAPADLQALKSQVGEAELKKLISASESGNDEDLSLAMIDGDKDKIAAVKLDEAMHGGMLTKVADGIAAAAGVDRSTMRTVVDTVVDVAAVAAAPIALPLAAISLVATGDKKDGKAVEKVLEGITDPAERARVAAEYQKHTGESLGEALDADFTGNEREVMASLERGDPTAAAVAKLKGARDHLAGPDKDELFGVFATSPEKQAELAALPLEERKARETELAKERQHIVAAFDAQARVTGGKTFDETMRDSLGEKSAAYAKVSALARDGKASDAIELDYALHGSSAAGVFADKDALKRVLGGKSKEELATLTRTYAAEMTARGESTDGLDKEIASAASGRDGFELDQMMKGKAQTPEDMMARAKERYEFERSGGDSMLGYGAMAVIGGPIGMAALAAGVRPSDISRFVTDMVSDSGRMLDVNEAALEASYAAYQAGDPGAKADVERFAANQNETTKSYGVAKDKVADEAATASGLAVSAAAAIATGGAASPLVAALAAGAGGVTSMGIKAVMKGNAYSNHELATDAVMTAVQAASAGTMSWMASGQKVAGMAALVRAAQHGAAGGLASGVAGAAMSEDSWRGNGLGLAGAIAKGGLLGAAGGAAQGFVSAGVAEGIGAMAHNGSGPLGAMLGRLSKENPALFNVAKATLGGVAGGSAQTVLDPAAYDDPEAFVKALGTNVGQGLIFSVAQGLGEPTAPHGPAPAEELEPITTRRRTNPYEDMFAERLPGEEEFLARERQGKNAGGDTFRPGAGQEAERVAQNHPGVVTRAESRLAGLPPEDQAVYHALTNTTENEAQRAILERAIAAGHPIEDVKQLAERMRGLDDDAVIARYTAEGMQQKFSHSCVPASMQVMAMEMDPLYAERLKAMPELAEREQRFLLEQRGGGRALDRAQSSGGRGMYPAYLQGSQPQEILERATGARYRNFGNGAQVAGAERSYDATPHGAIQAALAEGKPVLFTDPAHARALVGVSMEGGQPVYMVHDPWTGEVTRMTRAELDGWGNRPGSCLSLPEGPTTTPPDPRGGPAPAGGPRPAPGGSLAPEAEAGPPGAVSDKLAAMRAEIERMKRAVAVRDGEAAAAPATVEARRGVTVTPESIRDAMLASPYKTWQKEIYLPAVQGYVDKLRDPALARTVKPISIFDGDFLNDGHHRHVAALILGKMLRTTRLAELPPSLAAFWGVNPTHPIADSDLFDIITPERKDSR